MIDPDIWKRNVIELVQYISDKNFQGTAWFGNDQGISYSPEDLIDDYFDGILIERFLNSDFVKLTSKQIEVGMRLTKLLDSFIKKHPAPIDESLIIDDPEWDKIRETARTFYEALVEE